MTKVAANTKAANVTATAYAGWLVTTMLDSHSAPPSMSNHAIKVCRRIPILPDARSPAIPAAWLKDVRAPARPQALASDHDQCGYHYKKRDWCVAKAMSGCGYSDCSTGSKRERKQQRPSALEGHPNNKG